MNEIKTSTDQRNFCMIYHDFLDSDFLDSYEKMIFIYLKRFADTKGKCFPSLNKLSQISGFSKSTIQRTLKSLEEKKVLSIEHRKTDEGNKSNIYILYDLAEKWQKKELSAPATDAQESQSLKTDNKTIEKESQEEKQECMDSKDERQEKKRAEQEEREKDQNGSGIESVNIESQKWHSDSKDSKEVLAAYETLIKNNIAYADLCISHQYDKKLIDELISNILDVVMSNNATIKIAGEQKNIALVKSVFLKLNYYQIEYVLQKYHQITTRITNKRQYILTMLYNAHLEAESDIINEVAHDLSVLPHQTSISTTGDREKDIKNLANYLL